MALDNQEMLLTYSVCTTPAPLQVSTATPTPGQLTITVAPSPTVRCKRIIITVPIGDGAGDLFRVDPMPTDVRRGWNADMGVMDMMLMMMVVERAPEPDNYTSFTLKHPDDNGGLLPATGLSITISGDVSLALGTASISIQELSTADSDGDSFSFKNMSLDMDKSPAPALYIKSFYSTDPSKSTNPVTEFENGSPIRLGWESNGTYFEVYKKGLAKPVWPAPDDKSPSSSTDTKPTPVKYCDLPGVTTDTTFILKASLGDETHKDYLFEALTVTVSNPSLTPNKVEVSGPVNIEQTLVVQGRVIVLDKLDVSGSVTIVDKLDVCGPVTIDKKLAVSGPVTIAGSNVLEFGADVAGKEQETGKIGYRTDSLDITGAGSSINRQIKFLSEGGASFTGNINLEAKHDLILADWNHGIGFYGGEKYWGKGENEFVNYSPNGPVVYGWNGGVLGSTAGGKKSVLVWNSDGRVGIGTTAPTAKLDVEGNVRVSGYVGIGTATPGFPLHVVSDAPYSSAWYGFTNIEGPGKIHNSNKDDVNHFKVSIKADARIVADEFDAISDVRLKTVIGLSDHAADLALLRRLRITDYTMRDQVQYGDKAFKKIIAQELEKVFPQAVSQHTSFLPDIYARPSQVQQQGDALLLTLPAGLPEAVAAGQRLKLIGPTGEVVATLAEAAEAGSQQLVVAGATSLAQTPHEVFIFGLERPDVRTVDYDAVAMLHVSATQALARQVEELHQQNAALQAQSATLHEQLQAQRAECSQTRAALEQLQAQVASLLSTPVAAIGTPAFAPSAS